MDGVGHFRGEQGEGAAEGTEIGSEVGVETGEVAVDEAAAQFPFQFAEAPALEMFDDATTQEAIGRDAVPSGAGRGGITLAQALPDEVDQVGVLEQAIDGIEEIVAEQRGLPVQRSEEKPGLTGGGRNHAELVPILNPNRLYLLG
jgi:hypothetical protein